MEDYNGIVIVLGLIFSLLMLVAEWRLIEKAGGPGWSVLVPIYNVYVKIKIADLPWWVILLILIPYVNYIVMLVVYFSFYCSYVSPGMAIATMFLPIIFVPYMAFSDTVAYQGDYYY